MPGISVLALGNWGTALANHLAKKGFDVLGWTIEQEICDSINLNHKNSQYLRDVGLHKNLKVTTDLDLALQNHLVLLTFPSAILSKVVPQMKPMSGSTVISAIKGIEQDSLLTPLQYADKFFGDKCKYAVISGPSFAKDVVIGKPVGVVSASKDEAVSKEVASLFTNEAMKVYTSVDPLGVEIGGSVKNVIALAAGVCDGLNFGDSARAGLITRGLAEMMRLAQAMGASMQTLAGLSGLGDLVLTATCDASRNRSVGLRLGRGEGLKQIIESLGSVAEAVHTTPLVLKLAQKYAVDMPITQAVSMLLAGACSASELAKSLITRPMKREFD